MRRRATLVLICAIAVLTFGEAAFAWIRPVETAVVDGWRPPENVFGAGNRGVDFAPVEGTLVKAAGDGRVTFAGQVGGKLYVVVTHDGGVRTTYGDLATIDVAVGRPVAAGDSVGKSSTHLHFGVRVDGSYVDPNTLFGRARLIPTD